MGICLNPENASGETHLPFPERPGQRIVSPLHHAPGFMEERELRPGFSLYYTEYAPAAPVVMASDSWPAGFGWIFFLSGKIQYNHNSLDREVEMETGMNRLAFQPGRSGSARLLPGAPIRVVTLTMTRDCFVHTLAQDLGLLPPCFRRAADSRPRRGCFALNPNTPQIQSALTGLVNALSRPRVPRLLVEGFALELIGLQFEQLAGHHSPPALPPKERDKIVAARSTLVRQMEDPPSLVNLARQVGLSPNRLSSGFKTLYGTTPFALLRAERMNHARQLLEESRMNVTEAALAVGYDSLSHFSKAFYKTFGINPGRARGPLKH